MGPDQTKLLNLGEVRTASTPCPYPIPSAPSVLSAVFCSSLATWPSSREGVSIPFDSEKFSGMRAVLGRDGEQEVETISFLQPLCSWERLCFQWSALGKLQSWQLWQPYPPSVHLLSPLKASIHPSPGRGCGCPHTASFATNWLYSGSKSC